MSSHYRTAPEPPLFASVADSASCASTAASRREFLPTQANQSARREGKRELILERLRIGPLNTLQLMLLGGSGFSSRLAELRRDGHRIDCEEHEDGAVYTLLGPKP
jgi:hypothetical protein